MKEIRLGTIGSGQIVQKILNEVMRVDGIALEAVYSRTQEKGRDLADRYHCEKVYTDMDAFLADDRIGAVYLATPNLLHYEQAKRALLAGKHVLCEKPFVTRLSQAEELAALAEENHLLLAETAPTTYLPNYQVLKRELPKLGQIRLVMSNYSQYSSRYDLVLRGEKPNIFRTELAGGSFMDINFYNILLNVALFGKPLRYEYYPNRYPGLADTSGSMVMQYDGFVSQNAGAKDTWGVNYFQIEGEKGYLYIEGGSNGLRRIRVVTRESEKLYNEQPDDSRLYYEIKELTRLLAQGDPAPFRERMQITLNTIEVMENARKAAGILFPGEFEADLSALS